MKNYSIKFILSICTIILLSITYIGIKNSNDCWVCEGNGENDCVVCINGKIKEDLCAFCDGKGKNTCTLCDGTGKTN